MTEFQGQQPAQIQVTVVVNLKQHNFNLQIDIDPRIPLINFIEFIKQQIFAQPRQAQYEETISLNEVEYELENVGNIKKQEVRNLADIGFTQGCKLILKLREPPICKVHNQPITNVCIQQHTCKNRLLCASCIFQHKYISEIKMPSLTKFKEQVQQNIKYIVDCPDLLNQVKILEIKVNLIIASFSYSAKKLIKLIEKIYQEVSNVKNNLENLWPEKLSERELEVMVKYLDKIHQMIKNQKNSWQLTLGKKLNQQHNF